MSHQPPNTPYVRRVVLPSGREIEVVYFEELVGEPAPTVAPTPDEGLHICPECTRGLVYPVEWEEVSQTHWEVFLRCPNCEWTTVSVYDQETVDRFDQELDRGTELLVRDLKRLTRANMEDEVEFFRSALDSDAIWPMDF